MDLRLYSTYAGTPVGRKYIPYSYMDPWGCIWPWDVYGVEVKFSRTLNPKPCSHPGFLKPRNRVLGGSWDLARHISPRVQVPNNHILSKILTYITTILNPST